MKIWKLLFYILGSLPLGYTISLMAFQNMVADHTIIDKLIAFKQRDKFSTKAWNENTDVKAGQSGLFQRHSLA